MLLFALFAMLTFSAGALQQESTPNVPNQPSQDVAPRVQMSPYAQEREAALAPALQALKSKDYAAALADLRPLVEKYPNDVRVLLLAGNAARTSRQYEEALRYYQKATLQPHRGWAVEFGLIETEAALGLWEDFDAQRQKVRAAKENNDSELARLTGYVIDVFDVGNEQVTAMEFPMLMGRFHARYRFFIKSGSETDAADGKKWTPMIDLESDDVDQLQCAKAHPTDSVAGKRAFSLDGYPQPRTHTTLKFYPDGEPSYQQARADVIAALTGTLKALSSTTAH